MALNCDITVKDKSMEIEPLCLVLNKSDYGIIQPYTDNTFSGDEWAHVNDYEEFNKSFIEISKLHPKHTFILTYDKFEIDPAEKIYIKNGKWYFDKPVWPDFDPTKFHY